MSLDCIPDELDNLGGDVRVDRTGFLAVEPQQVLAGGYAANLVRRRPPRRDHEARLEPGIGFQREAHRPCSGVVAQDPYECAIRPERSNVARYIGSASRDVVDLSGTEHRHRPLRRNTIDGAVVETVEHDIAEAQYARGGEFLYQLRERFGLIVVHQGISFVNWPEQVVSMAQTT